MHLAHDSVFLSSHECHAFAGLENAEIGEVKLRLQVAAPLAGQTGKLVDVL